LALGEGRGEATDDIHIVVAQVDEPMVFIEGGSGGVFTVDFKFDLKPEWLGTSKTRLEKCPTDALPLEAGSNAEMVQV
jgi:hypothetical protein